MVRSLVVDKWLVGKEVKGFEKDTVYVVRITGGATPPSTVGVAVLSDLHDKYAGKGLVVVGVQSPNYRVTWDSKKLEEELTYLTTSTKESGVSYPVAWEKERKLYAAYVGKDEGSVAFSVEVAFVVDKAGKIAYFGPDGTAAYVSEKVLDGTWKGQADANAITELEAKQSKFMQELFKTVGQPDKLDDKAIKTLRGELPALEKMYKDAPFLLNTGPGWGTRFFAHLFAQSYEVLEEMIAAKVATAQKRKNRSILSELGQKLASIPLKPNPKLAKVVAKFTDAYAGLLDPKKSATEQFEDWIMLVVLSTTHGNAEKADAYTKSILDGVPADKRKEMEAAIQRRLKDAGVGDK
jgi:hypothetical protein